jgi:hypothetical protein
VANVPWASLVPTVSTGGDVHAPGYAIDLVNKSYASTNFVVQTYPEGLPSWAPDEDPHETAFIYHVQASATPMTRAEFIAMHRGEAEKLRRAVLADRTASSALVVLAADAANWGDLYITALAQAGLLRSEDVPPAIRANPTLVSLMATLTSGILAGPAGNQIITDGNLPRFFEQVRTWYGDKDTPLSTIGSRRRVKAADPRPNSDYDLRQTRPTQHVAFSVFVRYSNSLGDAFPDEEVEFVDPGQPNLGQFLGSGIRDRASISGPLGHGPLQFLPVGQALPYTIQFASASEAASAAGEVRIITQLDSDLDPRSFRLGSLQIGDIQVNVPAGLGSFQGDFDFVRSKGFILRVSAGIDVHSSTATWLFQAIDPETGEVIQDPARGVLPPNNARGSGRGFVTYTMIPKEGTSTGTPISAKARILFNNAPPIETGELVQTIDGDKPMTTLTATPLTGGADVDVRWTAEDDSGGSGVKWVTVYVSEDGGDWKIWLRQTTATSSVYQGRVGHTYRFLGLAFDNAGNRELPPAGLGVPDDGSRADLGALPSVPETTQPDVGTPPPATNHPPANALFARAEQGIPSPQPITERRS